MNTISTCHPDMITLTNSDSCNIMKYFFFYLLTISVLTSSCQAPEGIGQEPYFSVQDLMKQQMVLLDSLNPEVKITGALKGQQETINTHKDSSAWSSLFQLFDDADINQPVLQGQYVATDTFDKQSNLPVRLYEAKEGTNTNIPYLKVYYQDSLKDVRRIETAFEEKNALYDTQRKMTADFELVQGAPRITQYDITGKQKMIMQDSVLYHMQASINYAM